MKKFYTILVFSLSLFLCKAQIVITGNDLPQAGKTFITSYDTTTQFTMGIASAQAQSWNFSGFQTHYNKVANYSPVTPNHHLANVFNQANMYTYGPSWMYTGFYGSAPVDMSDKGYLYWKSDSTGIRVVGFRGDAGNGDINVLENQSELLMGAPATYNSLFGNLSYWTLSFDVNTADYDTQYVCKTSKQLFADAFGTLTIGDSVYQVLRVHETGFRTDSIYITFNGMPIPGTGAVLRKDTLNNYFFWAQQQGYPVATIFCNSQNQIKKTEILTQQFNNHLISGSVFKNDGTTPITNGKVQLFARDAWDHLFGVEEVVDITPSGKFQFACVVGGNWLVQAQPDTTAFPGFSATYHLDGALWQDAPVIAATNDTSIAINCNYYATATGNNAGYIGGNITQNIPSKSILTTGAAQNVTVMLIDKNTSEILCYTKSDQMGNYHFANLPNAQYRVLVDIPGTSMTNTYEQTVSNSQHTDFNFSFDSAHVYATNLSSVVETGSEQAFSVYPNPTSEKLFVTNKSDKAMQVQIIDALGKAVACSIAEGNRTIQINCSQLNNGIYLFKISSENEKCQYSKLVIKK